MMINSGYRNDNKTRIILMNGSSLLREGLLRAFQKVREFEVVGVVQGRAELTALLSAAEADWLVISAKSGEEVSEIMLAIHRRHPTLAVAVIAADASKVLIQGSTLPEVQWERATLSELTAFMRKQALSVRD